MEASETELESADFTFEGKGEGGKPVDVGIELKVLSDLVSSLRSGRLAGEQLPKMQLYEYRWLVVEGRWRYGRQGQLEVYRESGARYRHGWVQPHGRMTGSELDKTLLTMSLRGGLRVRMTNNRTDTLHFLISLFHWFTDKSFEQHRSHLAVHTPQSFLPISEFRQVVSRFPGIGLRASLAVEDYFRGNLRKAVCASPAQWAEIPITTDKGKTRQLGAKTAARIVQFCSGNV